MAVATPISQTVAYAFDSAQHGADLFDLKVAGNIYTRIMNPTQAVLEARVAALEGGLAALAVASGQAAITYAIQTIAEAGDNIVSSSALYGGTYNLFAHTFPQYGIETRFADYRKPESFEPLIDSKTKAIYVESLGNPQGNVTDIAAIACGARDGGADAVTVINTCQGMAVDWRRRRPLLGNVIGGLSGPAIKPIALRCVHQIRRAVDIPIIGVGGIMTLDDCMEFFITGATAVQIGTANFAEPVVSTRLLDALPAAEPAAVARIAPDVAVRLRAVPLRVEAGRLVLAMVDPLDIGAVDEAAALSRLPVVRVGMEPALFSELMRATYGTTAARTGGAAPLHLAPGTASLVRHRGARSPFVGFRLVIDEGTSMVAVSTA
jgi:hypothetical protein